MNDGTWGNEIRGNDTAECNQVMKLNEVNFALKKSDEHSENLPGFEEVIRNIQDAGVNRSWKKVETYVKFQVLRNERLDEILIKKLTTSIAHEQISEDFQTAHCSTTPLTTDLT